jgi:hypothetical protein
LGCDVLPEQAQPVTTNTASIAARVRIFQEV